MNPDLPNPGVTEATPVKLQANAFLLWVFGLMNFCCLMMFFFFGFVDEFVVWWCFFFSRVFDDVFSLGFLFEICFGGLISNIEIDSPKLDLPSAFFFVVLLGSSSMESFLLRAWVLHRVLPWVPFFITIFLQFLQIFIMFFKFIIFFYGTRIFKTRVPCGKNISMFAIRTRGFEARFLHWTRASKTQEAILQTSSWFLLTNDILWQSHATLQIPSTNSTSRLAKQWSTQFVN